MPTHMLSKLDSIFIKLTIIAIVVTAAVTTTLAVMSRSASHAQIERIIRERAVSETEAFADDVAGGVRFGRGDKVYDTFDLQKTHSNQALAEAIALKPDGSLVVDASRSLPDSPALVDLALKALSQGGTVVSDDGFSAASLAHFGDGTEIVGVVATRWTPEHQLASLRSDEGKALLTSSAVFLLSVIGNMFLMYRLVTRPLGQIQAVIQGFKDRNYDRAVPLQGRKDELGSIAASLEELRGTLAHARDAELENTFKGTAFMTASAAMLLTDLDGKITHTNAKMIALFATHKAALSACVPGFDPHAMIGLSVEAFLSGQKDLVTQGGAQMGSGPSGNDQPFTAVIKLGEARISLSASVIRDKSGHEVGYVMEWSDVTDNWLNAAVIQAIEASQIKAEFSPQGALLTANAPFLDMMGQSLELLQHRPLPALLDSASGQSADVLQAAHAGKTFVGMLRLVRDTDQPAIIDGSLDCVKDHQGQIIRLLLLGKDVTRSEAELRASRKGRAEAEAQQTAVVEALRLGLRKLNLGDLTAQITEPFAGTYEDLRQDFNETVRSMADAMQDILNNAKKISNDAGSISSTAENLSLRTESTAATLEQAAAALDALTTSVKGTAAGAERADLVVSAAKEKAEGSGRVVVEMVSAMDQIATSSDRITSIIKVIDDIAFQTNLLALNAGVEAARAGDAGRGFAVVASEVRSLAKRSSDAAREINDLINNSATQVRMGVDLVDKTGEALTQIVSSVSEIAMLVSDIAGASREQSVNLVEINNSVMQLDQSTQQNAARLEETTAASEGLTREARSLVATVGHFKMVEGDPKAAVQKPAHAPRFDMAG